jgi:hypothetical protein
MVYLRIMKRLGKIVVCLAGGLLLSAGARAENGVLPNNPYAPIVVRNIFALNPLPPVDAAPPGDPPPKITPNGIMSIFGQLQVLFKVAGTAKPGQPAKDEAYILSEGQRQDEIEVTHIDEQASLVTFNNHGTVQELPLIKANPPAVSTPTPAQGRLVPPNLTAPNGENNSRIPSRLGGGPGAARNRSRGDGSPLTTVPTPGSYGQSGQSGQIYQPQQNTMTPEAQVTQAIIAEAQRAQWQKEGNPAAAVIPPTVLMPQNRPGGMPPIP